MVVWWDSADFPKSLIVLMFFIPYVIFQPPMTIVTRKLGPTFFLGSIIVSWAVIMVVCKGTVLYGEAVSLTP